MGTIVSSGAKGSAIDHFIEFMLDNMNFTKKSDALNLIIAFTVTRGGVKLKEKLASLATKSKYVEKKLAESLDMIKGKDLKEPEEFIDTDEEGYEAEPAFEDEMEEAPDFEDEFAEAVV
jgi:hypothetical protein